jgi:hydrogenase nickel incorporation protein HypA/HybF
MAPGTMVQGAELLISQPAAQLDCHQCGIVQDIPDLIMTCPLCGSADVAIQGGTELMLVSIDLE